jgi:hypothetical protein
VANSETAKSVVPVPQALMVQPVDTSQQESPDSGAIGVGFPPHVKANWEQLQGVMIGVLVGVKVKVGVFVGATTLSSKSEKLVVG